MDDRPLRLVGSPEIEPQGQSDEWRQGWNACRKMLGEEWAVWYARGVAAREVEGPTGAAVAYGLVALGGFIFGFVIAVAAFR